MSEMNITKSKFMEYVRCNRYPALNKMYRRKEMDDAAMDKFYDLVDSLEGISQQDVLDVNDIDTAHLDVMMPYFEQVEVLTARKVMADFGGETKYGTKYGTQKLFMREHQNFNLMCYIDIYNKTNDDINIVEVKATTSNKYLNMTYRENKVEHSLFYVDDQNILHLSETRDKSYLASKKYLAKRKKLMERFRDEGVYTYDLAFQRFVIGDTIEDATYYLGVLNHAYVFDGTYIDGEPNYTNDIIRLIDVTVLVEEMQGQIESDINSVIERILEDDMSRVKLGKYCQLKKMRECVYKDLCYDKFPKKNSILMFIDKHHGFKDPGGETHDYFDMIDDGMRQMEDVPSDWLHRKNNIIQQNVATTKIPHIDYQKIRDGIETIQYPIYHLDFESFPCPLPRFSGETPYTQSLFQFSLHIETAPGVCDKEQDHYEFLAKDHNDNRKELVEQLCHHIKDDGGSVMVYNQAFEKTRIKELAVLFPNYSDTLLAINERLFDLMYIVKTNSKLYQSLGFDDERAKTINYYHEDLDGSYSIKKVLPIFSELTYAGMVVGNGMQAVYAYASYQTMTQEEKNKTINALIEYCKQDTWAMVEILDNLRKI
ncbi:MAG: DUF2779 domain-containing protein [Candidatus Izimaplasma sp.]|nr:DUF2779 domain-containing protein [Candidatus Izimaplasma bacterium]